MAWPLFTTSARPTAAGNAANTGLYANGSQSHSFATRVWVSTTPGVVPSAFTASFTHLTQNRKANYEPGAFDARDVTHNLSPYRHKERRSSWGNPGQIALEFNYTTAVYERQSALTPSPAVADDNHRYLIVEDPDGSVQQLYGWFDEPKKQHDCTANENVIEQTFMAGGVSTFVKSA